VGVFAVVVHGFTVLRGGFRVAVAAVGFSVGFLLCFVGGTCAFGQAAELFVVAITAETVDVEKED
jgi:hypothetical protein